MNSEFKAFTTSTLKVAGSAFSTSIPRKESPQSGSVTGAGRSMAGVGSGTGVSSGPSVAAGAAVAGTEDLASGVGEAPPVDAVGTGVNDGDDGVAAGTEVGASEEVGKAVGSGSADPPQAARTRNRTARRGWGGGCEPAWHEWRGYKGTCGTPCSKGGQVLTLLTRSSGRGPRSPPSATRPGNTEEPDSEQRQRDGYYRNWGQTVRAKASSKNEGIHYGRTGANVEAPVVQVVRKHGHQRRMTVNRSSVGPATRSGCRRQYPGASGSHPPRRPTCPGRR